MTEVVKRQLSSGIILSRSVTAGDNSSLSAKIPEKTEVAPKKKSTKTSTKTAVPPIDIPPQLIPYVKRYKKTGAFAQFRFYTLLKRDSQENGGSGWIDLGIAFTKYTNKVSPWHICTRGNLWKILDAGDGLFWTVDRKKDRLFLRSWHKIAASLGCYEFDRIFVAMPMDVAVGGIKKFRKATYAAVLSLNTKKISKASLVEKTGFSESSLYEHDAKLKEEGLLKITPNYVIEPIYTNEHQKRETIERMIPWAFPFTDNVGSYFKPGQTCLAWRCANSYKTYNAGISRRRKQTRHHVIDLENNTSRGNDDKGRRDVVCDDRNLVINAHDKTGTPKLYRAMSKNENPYQLRVGMWRPLEIVGSG
jgi:hypothetical protein